MARCRGAVMRRIVVGPYTGGGFSRAKPPWIGCSAKRQSGDREDIRAVYVGHTAPLPARVRAFIDFLAEHVRVSNPALKRAGDGRWRLVK
jgi:DNA-binding transcriptional LysR family regulator